MKRWPILVATVLGMMTTAASGAAQDVPLTKPKKPAAAKPARPAAKAHARAPSRAATPKRQDPVAGAARATADIASKEAICLREAAHQVRAAAQKLEGTRDAKEIAKRRGDLEFAVGVLQECRNIAKKRLAKIDQPAPVAPQPAAKAPEAAAPSPAPPAAPTPSPEPERPALDRSNSKPSFSFGGIRIEEGRVDAAALVGALRRSAPELTRCYASARQGTPALQGNLQLRMRFGGSGKNARPSSVIIPDSSLSNDAMHRCLARTLMGTSFGRTQPGSQVSLKMAFAPERK